MLPNLSAKVLSPIAIGARGKRSGLTALCGSPRRPITACARSASNAGRGGHQLHHARPAANRLWRLWTGLGDFRRDLFYARCRKVRRSLVFIFHLPTAKIELWAHIMPYYEDKMPTSKLDYVMILGDLSAAAVSFDELSNQFG